MKLEEMKEDIDHCVSLEMVLIPAGKFKMGCPTSEKDYRTGENLHEVTLKNSFYMGKYEVTQEQWQAVMGNNPSYFKGVKLPVTDVSWDDCQEFIKKLNARTKGGVTDYLTRQSGNMLVGRELRQRIRLGIISRTRMQTMGGQRLRNQWQWEATNQMRLGFTICMAMSGSGVRIGMMIILRER